MVLNASEQREELVTGHRDEMMLVQQGGSRLAFGDWTFSMSITNGIPLREQFNILQLLTFLSDSLINWSMPLICKLNMKLLAAAD